MNNIILSIGLLMVLPLAGIAQVELMVAPTNVTIHVAEPVRFEVAARNRGNSPVSGFFILNGRYDGFSIEVRKMGDTKSHRFANAVMWEGTKDDMMFQPITLKPSEERSVNYVLLYNVRTGGYVFDVPGEYEVHFRLLWNPKGGDVISATAHVTVVEWDAAREEDRKQLEALAIWKNREIASVVQDNAELSRYASEKLQELKEKYAGTLYGKLASDLLARVQKRRTPDLKP